MMNPKTAMAISLLLFLLLLCVPVFAADDDFDAVTGHVSIEPPSRLAILYPAKDVQTTASGFQITGTSDPAKGLTLNGDPVEDRGAGGTFAVYVPLESGKNTFVFRQGGESASLAITRGKTNSTFTAATNVEELPKPLPQFDLAVKSGESFSLKCYAPAATAVTATINGDNYTLTKNGYYFTGSYPIPPADGTVQLGAVTYTITEAGGTRTELSEGGLFAVGKDATLSIRVKSVSATVFEGASPNSAFLTTAKQNAVDQVTGYSGDLYHLATGGWISAKSVEPLLTGVRTRNSVQSISFGVGNGMETYTFHGDSHPMYRATHTDSTLQITLYHTAGIPRIDIRDSELFSDVSVTQKDGHSTLKFTLSSPGLLWGYLVEYRDGQTILSCKYRPKLSDDAQRPLTGITVAVDAGHGGNDPGTLGVTYGHGKVEKDINLETAIALQKKLELLGAQTLMIREDDTASDLNSRLAAAQAARVDFLVSLHANSVAHSATAAAANGVEVYYYEPISKELAGTMAAAISDSTGRRPRGAKYTNFVMTLNSYAPSVLVEMGFLLNPSDFDSMCSKQGIYDTVTAVSDSIVAALKT